MRSVARLFYIRSLSSSLARVPACTAVPVLILQQSSFCSEIDSERFSTKRSITDDDQSGSRPNRLFLEQIQGVPRNQSLVPMLRSWIKAGNQLGPVEMKLVFGKLDWRYKFSQALKVVEWLLKERPFEPVEDHYARWLLYLGKVSGYEKVERAFEDVPSEFQNEMVYCRLFDVALYKNKLTKAIGVMKRMRKQELPVPVYMFNNLITYYARNSLLYKLPGLLRLMEEQDIPYNLQTYNTLLSLTSKRADLEHMEEVWGLLKADDCVKPDFVSYSILASAYFFAGHHKKSLSAARKAERHLTGKDLTVLRLKKLIVMNGLLKQGESVSRIYRKLKALPGKTSVFSYTSVIEAYGEASLVDKAEEVLQEMELQCNMQHLVQYNTMIGVYCKNGMVRNAEEVLEKLLTNHKPDIVTHSHFLLGYLKSEEYERALQKLNALVNLVKGGKFDWFVFGSRAWLLSIHSAIGLFAERGDKEHAILLLTTLQETNIESFPSSYKFITNVYEQSFGCAWER